MQIEPLHNWITHPNELLLISGPCAAESYEQLYQTAKQITELKLPIHFFRAGIWKPRTRPNSFEGVGEKGLDWLLQIKKEFKLKSIIEVANANHANLAKKYNIDAVWIGARTTGNPFSVQEIADALDNTNIPVFIKNPIYPDVQLWLGAIERFALKGFKKIVAINRGCHHSKSINYRNDPAWQLTFDLKTALPNIPILCDPSHIAGQRNLIEEVAQTSINLGFEGVMIETHYNPDIALSDKMQQLNPQELKRIVQSLQLKSAIPDNDLITEQLKQYRNEIDKIDEEIILQLIKRNMISELIGEHKKKNNITVFQLDRWLEILNNRKELGLKYNISKDHIEHLCNLLHQESIKIQADILKQGN